MKPHILFAALAAPVIFLSPALHAQVPQLVNGQGGVPEGQVCTVNPVVTNEGDSGGGTLRGAVIEACAGRTITLTVTGTIPFSGDRRGAARISAIQHFSDGSAQLTLTSTVGNTCLVDKPNDLATWSSLGTVFFDTATKTITDPNPTHELRRFYQAYIR